MLCTFFVIVNRLQILRVYHNCFHMSKDEATGQPPDPHKSQQVAAQNKSQAYTEPQVSGLTRAATLGVAWETRATDISWELCEKPGTAAAAKTWEGPGGLPPWVNVAVACAGPGSQAGTQGVAQKEPAFRWSKGELAAACFKPVAAATDKGSPQCVRKWSRHQNRQGDIQDTLTLGH